MNWQKIVSEILDSGMTQTELAKQVHCSQNLISNLLTGVRGKRVSYEIGASLVAEHKKRKLHKGSVQDAA